MILVNKSSTFLNTSNVVNSVSDFHNMVATMMRFMCFINMTNISDIYHLKITNKLYI